MSITIDQIPDLVSQLTLEEKASLCSGGDAWHLQSIERLGIDGYMVTDGPHGLRKVNSAGIIDLYNSVPATCFPTAAGLASTWDTELVGEVGVALGEETRSESVAMLLGPGINMKRSPLCGRNFEYFAEDPVVAGELASALVRGIQSQGVGTSLKHFAANNQETDRLRVSAEVDERTLREIYLPAFEKVVKTAKPWTIMCSYNAINGTYSSQNHWLLTEVLRDEWGYDGLVVSDWGAVVDRVKGVLAGLDLEMPGDAPRNDARIAEAVRSGELDESVLDTTVTRVLTLLAKAGPAMDNPGSYDVDAHHALARRAAAGAAVLLKNDDQVLPLTSGEQVAVIGKFARTPRYQGAGSSKVNPTRLDTALDSLREAWGADLPFAPGFNLAGDADPDLVAEAVEAARGRTAVLFLGLPDIAESEGYDRTHTDMPANQIELLRAVREVAAHTVVVLSNGSSIGVAEWDDQADAILECWLGGQASGSGVADVLTGAVNPSGHLAETIALRLSDVPAQLNFPGELQHVHYGEGRYIGYRGLDATEREVAYPFGHGLSYTTFEYSTLGVEARPISESTNQDDPVVTLTFTVTNTGDRAGAAVPQVYVGFPDSTVDRCVRELRAFRRIELAPGQSEQVSIELTRRDLSYWDVILHDWAVEPGRVVVEVGASSRDLPLNAKVDIEAPRVLHPLRRDSTVAEWMEQDEEFAAKVRSAAKKVGFSADMEDDPTTASFLLTMPVYKVLQLAPVMSPEELDEMLGE
ncbi:MAG: glycoside hydrolase family 3 C-terminal domain-containing protein [Cutibacterium avidum]|uniref:glycoside hydrolase family 3 C-terminal domain-containing protein n=1 Tax=Cutibacterium avidum TaxID=33010 RepID=UPI0014875737|nr:glycoside hydrolase family 3 C-terminal domain-containing protein [Cutibacterium avidum]MDU2071602.1 glycoside hydrolase family 3 C-terminal domain-containing protein [Cutibacterium avidum]MDU3282897.1 glycoside hydrolase family 3 C-terminal domain-containing protein [Cutibacterium avidum]MDU3749838.1 glycoside hydrolase family 3 C-terminal domain-containing protein [Cutibacterium avidum]MDU7716652.1 glycoside hydrolase family 3 C-terminal domain-containing protein [Cutibacterium avidum]